MKKIKGIMTGLLICVFLIMGSMAVWADQTGAVSGQTRVFDQAGLFSETEKIQLEEEIAQCRKNTKMDDRPEDECYTFLIIFCKGRDE